MFFEVWSRPLIGQGPQNGELLGIAEHWPSMTQQGTASVGESGHQQHFSTATRCNLNTDTDRLGLGVTLAWAGGVLMFSPFVMNTGDTVFDGIADNGPLRNWVSFCLSMAWHWYFEAAGTRINR